MVEPLKGCSCELDTRQQTAPLFVETPRLLSLDDVLNMRDAGLIAFAATGKVEGRFQDEFDDVRKTYIHISDPSMNKVKNEWSFKRSTEEHEPKRKIREVESPACQFKSSRYPEGFTFVIVKSHCLKVVCFGGVFQLLPLDHCSCDAQGIYY